MKSLKALIVDDDPLICDITSRILTANGFQPFCANSGEEGLRELYKLQPDIVILDIMMPKMDGLTVLKRIRQLTDVPVIMLSAMIRTDVTVRALEMGADDYIKKPFMRDELLARIQSVLRRSSITSSSRFAYSYNDGNLFIDLEDNRVLLDGELVRLTNTEYKLLEYLYIQAEKICTYSMILEDVWGGIDPGHSHYIHVYVQRLRNKIERDPTAPKYIVTEHGIGYRFEKQKK